MRAGQSQLGQDYLLDRCGWLEVLLNKYTSASIWAWMWWCLIWMGWLILTWAGVIGTLGLVGRQLVWGIALLGLMAAGYAGACQAIRQSHLFLRVGRSTVTARDWLLFLVMPVLPLLLLWVIGISWVFLTSPPGFFAVVAALSLFFLILVKMSNNR